MENLFHPLQQLIVIFFNHDYADMFIRV